MFSIRMWDMPLWASCHKKPHSVWRKCILHLRLSFSPDLASCMILEIPAIPLSIHDWILHNLASLNFTPALLILISRFSCGCPKFGMFAGLLSFWTTSDSMFFSAVKQRPALILSASLSWIGWLVLSSLTKKFAKSSSQTSSSSSNSNSSQRSNFGKSEADLAGPASCSVRLALSDWLSSFSAWWDWKGAEVPEQSLSSSCPTRSFKIYNSFKIPLICADTDCGKTSAGGFSGLSGLVQSSVWKQIAVKNFGWRVFGVVGFSSVKCRRCRGRRHCLSARRTASLPGLFSLGTLFSLLRLLPHKHVCHSLCWHKFNSWLSVTLWNTPATNNPQKLAISQLRQWWQWTLQTSLILRPNPNGSRRKSRHTPIGRKSIGHGEILPD